MTNLRETMEQASRQVVSGLLPHLSMVPPGLFAPASREQKNWCHLAGGESHHRIGRTAGMGHVKRHCQAAAMI
jgi:hypothetical protein